MTLSRRLNFDAKIHALNWLLVRLGRLLYWANSPDGLTSFDLNSTEVVRYARANAKLGLAHDDAVRRAKA